MLQVLPELHDDSSMVAASVLLHILSGSATPSQLLQAAVATLHKLPLHNIETDASAAQIQLACDLVQRFTAGGFAALPTVKGRGKAAKAASPLIHGLEVLLQLLRLSPDSHQPESQQLAKLRLTAFERLGADLYAVMPVQQQMQAFLVGPLWLMMAVGITSLSVQHHTSSA